MSAPHRLAAEALCALIPELRGLHAQLGAPVLNSRERSAFQALARSIVYQQLAGAAARSIWGRVLTATGTPLSAARVSARTDEQLRACGLSAAKLRALRDLARQAPLLKLGTLHRCDDETVITRLTAIHGVGRWTAEMFLIFHLRRLDVWPAGDLGVREGYRRAFGLAERPSEKQLVSLGDPFKPYRSVAAWYLWRATELLPAIKEAL